MKNAVFAFISTASIFLFAAPTVSNVDVQVDGASRLVKVTYDLSEEAVVTFAFKTNGIALPGSETSRVLGDVCRRIPKGVGKSFVWRPERRVNRQIGKNVLTVEVTAWPLDNPPDYMEIDLVVTNAIRYYASVEALPNPLGATNDIYKTVKLLMRKVPAAGIEWKMGKAGSSNLAQQRSVKISENYYIGVFPVTWSQADLIGQAANAVTSINGFGNTTQVPSQSSYNNIRGESTEAWAGWPQKGSEVVSGKFIDKARRYTGVMLDLASSAQWEFACRAGTGADLYNGLPVSNANVEDLAWFNVNVPAEGRTYKVVGLKQPNAWGLYDMLGNIWEHCLDWYENAASSEYLDPKGPESSSTGTRMMRGGSVHNASGSCVSYSATSLVPQNNYGYRLAAPCEAPVSR